MIGPGSRPIAVAVVPAGLLWQLGLVLAATLCLALAAQVAIPLPFSPVPVTGQTLAVLLIGASLGARRAALATATYLLEGLVGLPVFAGGTSGVARLVGPTGGYLVGFVAAAAFVGWAAQRGWTRRLAPTVAAMLVGEVFIYACGLAWLSRFALPVGLIEAGLLPFIPGDLYKIALAASVLPPLTRLVARVRPGSRDAKQT